MTVIDLHCDALWRSGPGGRLKGEVTVEALRQGACLAQCFAVFSSAGRWDPYLRLRRGVGRWRRMCRRYEKDLAPVRDPGELRQVQKQGRIGALLTLENAGALGGKPARLAWAARQGVQMLSLTWNHPNRLGYPHSPDPLLHARGLTPQGRQTVEACNRLGILVDLSHLSAGGFWQALSLSRAPVAVSHACAYGLCPHSRNLTDDQLRALGNAGGVLGLAYYAPFLCPGAGMGEIEDVVAHARYVVELAGEDALCLGGDLDGMDLPTAFGGWKGVPELVQALEKAFGSRRLEKICYGNFLRVWQGCKDGSDH